MKFAINQRGGKVNVKELATATAQREATISIGLEWLAAGGHLKVEDEADEIQCYQREMKSRIHICNASYISQSKVCSKKRRHIEIILSRADAESLFKF